LHWPQETLRTIRSVAVKLLVSCILLALIHSLEIPITELITDAVRSTSVAEYLYLVLYIPSEILVSYFVYRLYVAVSVPAIRFSLAKLKVRTAGTILLLLNRIFGLVILITTALWILSSQIPFLSGYAQSVFTSFSGLFSILLTLIVAMQMKELVGNSLAGLMIKSSNLINEDDYISLGNDKNYLRVEKIDQSFTQVVNILGERTFIPNLNFLTENVRKPFFKGDYEYVDLRFDMSYDHSQKQVEQDMSDLVDQYNRESQQRKVKIAGFTLVLVDLAAYAPVYELRLKPSAPVFPEAVRSDFRQLLFEKYGEDMATPLLHKKM